MIFVEFLEFVCRIAYASQVEVKYECDSDESDGGCLKPKTGKLQNLHPMESTFNLYED